MRSTSHYLRIISPKSEFSIISLGNSGYVDNISEFYGAGMQPTSVQITKNLEDNTLNVTIPFQDDVVGDLRDLTNSVIMDFTFVEYGAFYDNVKRPLVYGEVRSVEYTDITITLTIGGFLNRLTYGQVFQISPSCRWIFGGDGCGFNLAALGQARNIGTISTDRFSFTLNSPVAFNEFYNGKITLSLNGGATIIPIDVSLNETNRIYLWEALPPSVVSGQAITLFPGCRKTETDCRDVYNNISNFGGVPKTSSNFLRGSQQFLASSKNLR